MRHSGRASLKVIAAETLRDAVKELCIQGTRSLAPGMREALERAFELEESPLGKEVLRQLSENARIAEQEGMHCCQDTGLPVIFVDLGEEVRIEGGSLQETINEGVRRAFLEGYFLTAFHRSPLEWESTGPEVPPIIHTRVIPGDRLALTFLPKGGGAEHTSRVSTLPPYAGKEGVKSFVLRVVNEAGAGACPPVIVGLGMGGTLEAASLLAKRTLLRRVGEKSRNPLLSDLEQELLSDINKLGIGPQGYGGRVTALAVHAEMMTSRASGFPLAVNLQCNSHRLRRITL